MYACLSPSKHDPTYVDHDFTEGVMIGTGLEGHGGENRQKDIHVLSLKQLTRLWNFSHGSMRLNKKSFRVT
jgi:hypothetical protein